MINNRAEYGGAVFGRSGSLVVEGSRFTDNRAYVDGGAVGAMGLNVTISASTFSANDADRNGGALSDGGVVTTVITGSSFTDNSAAGYGGGIQQKHFQGGEFTLTSSTLSGNTAAYGAGIYVRGGYSSTIDRTTISGNQSDGSAGGLVVKGPGDFTLRDSAVSGNESAGRAGGVWLYDATSALVTGSSIADNTSTARGGGLLIGGNYLTEFPIDVVDSTISGNAAGEGVGSGVYAAEAAQYNARVCRGCLSTGRITFTHSTIAGNAGDGLASAGGDVTLQGSIVADNTADLVVAQAPGRSATRPLATPGRFLLDYSLVEKPGDGLTQDVTAGSNLLGVDPQLGALADNGGPTPTMLPAATSPVLDKAKAFDTTLDQRGLARPIDLPGIANAAGGDASDIGAVELKASNLPTAPAATGSCDGAIATIVAKAGLPTFGTPGRDVIVGTAGADSISGGGGDDLICGLGGDDAIDTGAGRNRVFGGDGNDLIKGGSSRDVLFGDAGDDRIHGGRANDTIDGGAGNDTIRGNRGNDKIKGGGGKDYLRGGKNRDTLTGGPGKDKVRGGQAKDKVKS